MSIPYDVRAEKVNKIHNNNSLYQLSLDVKHTNKCTDVTKSPTADLQDFSLSNKFSKYEEQEQADIRKYRRWPTDKAYFISKELLMTERTYKKDLNVINVWFREEISRESKIEGDYLIALIELLADAHGPCLQQMESRLSQWESNGPHNIGEFLYNMFLTVLPLYDQYLENIIPMIEKLENSLRTSKYFEQLCRNFEAQKYCYLPLSLFLLKPLQRLLHYNNIIDRLLDNYPKDHTDFEDCLAAKDRLGETLLEVLAILHQAANLVQLCELQRDISGFDNLLQEGRQFIRQGCLQKYSRKGFQQRMFFLFSDVLLYTMRTQHSLRCFRVQGQLTLKSMKVQESDIQAPTEFTFLIRDQENQSLTVSANSEEEKMQWVEDLNVAIMQAENIKGQTPYLNITSCILGCMDEVEEDMQSDFERISSADSKSPQRSNTSVHVCWHRNTSISYSDQFRAFQNQLSGFLLRKFKNSNGWQKLWVVFTNFCLFFYKTYEDDFPLASLPLLGYTVSSPTEIDEINKDFVFKLQFKNHVYFFRTESEYTFTRWMEVLKSLSHRNYLVQYGSKEDC